MQPRTIASALGTALVGGAAWLCLSVSPASRVTAVTGPEAPREFAPIMPTRPFAPTVDALPAPDPVSVRAHARGQVNGGEICAETWADLARQVLDPVKRTVAIADALRSWSATDPGAALVWLSTHPEEETAFLVQSIGEGAAQNPGMAIPFALTYLAQDRELGALLAGALVRGLAERGEARSAVQLARAAPEGWEHQWTSIAFTNLAYEDAATALEALSGVEDPALHRTTAAAIIAGWAERDPSELAAHLDVFAVLADREAARDAALRKWRKHTPDVHHSLADPATPRG